MSSIDLFRRKILPTQLKAHVQVIPRKQFSIIYYLMAEGNALVNEELSGSDEDSEGEPGIKSAYSFEDLLDVLNNDSNGIPESENKSAIEGIPESENKPAIEGVPDSENKPAIEGVPDSENKPALEIRSTDVVQPETSNLMDTSVYYINVASEDLSNGISSQECDQHAVVMQKQECSADSTHLYSLDGDETYRLTDVVLNGNDTANDTKVLSTNTVTVAKDDGRTYDEVYVEGFYQNPLDESEGRKILILLT